MLKRLIVLAVITVAVLLLAPVVVNALLLYRRRFRLFLMLNAAALSALVLSDLAANCFAEAQGGRS